MFQFPSPMRRVSAAPALLGCLLAACGSPPPPDAASVPELPLAVLNDLRQHAGHMEDGSLVVALDVVQAAWTPRGTNGPRVAAPVFAEAGGAPLAPGPLIRLTVGTTLRLTIRNTLSEPVRIETALGDAALFGEDGMQLEAGESRAIDWTPQAPVSSMYFIRTRAPEGPSMGALIVDPAGTVPHPDERILFISAWGSNAEPTSLDPSHSWKMLVNGRSWPYTERFDYTVGDTVRWRVINARTEWHPMHLHGFYFRVTSTGDLRTDTMTDPAEQAAVVTHSMAPAAAMTLIWVPTTAGNWLFHCHLLRHMGTTQRFVRDVEPEHGAADGTAMSDGMAGLITGIVVHPAADSVAIDTTPARRLGLWTSSQANGYGNAPRLAFVLQEGNTPPAPDVVPPLSSLLVLQRDEPVEISVHNRLPTPLSVHWHGLELESEYDGVGHWSGMPGMPRPPIPPGASANVHLRPPRAGTFIYHTHGEDGFELSQGLYGPLIVLPPGETFDAERDRLFVLGQGGAVRDADPAVNGMLEPAPERFAAGQSYRLRFIQIGADEAKEVSLLRDGEPVSWRALAKDGADLPAALQSTVPARFRADVGETFDFEWTPESDGAYQLVVRTLNYPIAFDRGPTQTIAFAVGAVSDEAIAAAHAGFDGVLSLATINALLTVGTIVVPLLLLSGLGWGGWAIVRRIRLRRRLRAEPVPFSAVGARDTPG